MGGLNHPELATRAGEEPLPLSDDSELEEDPMEVDRAPQQDSERADLVRLAGNALPFTEKHDEQGSNREKDRENALKIENWRPQRPTVLTDSKHSPLNECLPPDEHKRRPIRKSSGHERGEEHLQRTASRAVTDGPLSLGRDGSQVGLAKSPSKSPNILNDDNTVSNVMRRNTLPASQHSPTETLPPLQSQASPANSTKPPSGPENLPSLAQSNLTDLLKSKPPPDSRYKDLAMSQIPIKKAMNSPPPGPMTSKASTSYPSPRSRMNSAFGPTFSHGHPSPVPSETSPRDSAVMSPPDRPGSLQFSQFQFSAQSSQSEELTPQSAHSYPSSASYSTAPSPQVGAGEQMEVDRAGRILPPLVPHPGPALMTGAFKCEYQGCTAAPFQTQYLLTSHANVHSQKRPHYCPVADCNRSEGGKGFKRKNEMIRHGLVHDSPGYVCPFCPEREHKYPRPDNLQRHVRVNHVGKDMNDPQLREVLSQRQEGSGRGRRRRVGS